MEMFPFLWTCAFLPLIRGHSLFTCEPVIVPRCMKMTYNMTFFPNLMGHYDQNTAAVEMEVSSSFTPVWKTILCSILESTLSMSFLKDSKGFFQLWTSHISNKSFRKLNPAKNLYFVCICDPV